MAEEYNYSQEALQMLEGFKKGRVGDTFADGPMFWDIYESCRAEQEAQTAPGIVPVPDLSPDCVIKPVLTAAGNTYYVMSKEENPQAGSHKLNIFYIHGGGMLTDISPRHWEFGVQLLNDFDCVVSQAVYPLAPTHTWQETYGYLLDMYRDILSNNPGQEVVFLGGSAGGYLVLALAMLALEEGLPQPKIILPCSPMVDTMATSAGREDLEAIDPMIAMYGLEKVMEAWAPEGDRAAWRPNVMAGPLQGLAPIHIFVGSREALMPDSLALQKRAAAEGIDIPVDVCPGMWHMFIQMLEVPEARAAYEKLKELINQ